MRSKALILASIYLLLSATVSWGQGDDTLHPQALPDGVNPPITSIVYDADFNDSNAWQDGESPDGVLTYSPTEDGLLITSQSPDGGIGSLPFINLNIDNFYTEISFRVESCTSEQSALLMFTRVLPSISNNQFNDAFVYVIQCSGDFRARALQNGNINDVVISGQTIPLEEGENYVMGILMAENTVAWYLNQEEVAKFEIPSNETRNSGTLTPGAQLGFQYTLQSWRVWALKSTGTNLEDTTIIEPTTNTDDPLANNRLGNKLYEPSFEPPSSIPLGLHHDVAAYIIGGGQALNLYNTRRPFGILAFEGIDQANYFLETAFSVRNCSETSSIGFVWRANDTFTNYYAFEVQCDGIFRAFLVEDGTETETFISRQLDVRLTDISQDIRLGVYVLDDTVYLYGDGTLFSSFSDNTLSSGHTGLLLSSDEDTGQPMDVIITDLVVFDVP